MVDAASLVLFAVVLCELALLVFMFCIGRFYELKFKDRTFHVSFLVPAAVFVSVLLFYLATGRGLEYCTLFTSACTLLVMMTTGLFLYRKMMGVSG